MSLSKKNRRWSDVTGRKLKWSRVQKRVDVPATCPHCHADLAECGVRLAYETVLEFHGRPGVNGMLAPHDGAWLDDMVDYVSDHVPCAVMCGGCFSDL